MQTILSNYGIYIAHFDDMAKDKSYLPKNRAKFIGWLRKWKNSRMVLLLALFIEVLSPAKILSLGFQSEDIDIIGSISKIKQSKRRLKRLKETPFEDLPTVKRVIESVTVRGSLHYYQDIPMHNFGKVKEDVKKMKDFMVTLVETEMSARLEADESAIIYSAGKLLDTAGWDITENGQSDKEKVLREIYTHFEVPLRSAGFVGDVDDLVEQWEAMVEYTVNTLNPSRISYLKVWYKFFNSPIKSNWPLPLLIAELLFTLPVSEAVVERLFSLTGRVKPTVRASLGEERLNTVIRICHEGPDLENFDATKAMQLWYLDKVRRPGQKGKRTYTQRKSTKLGKTLAEQELSEDSDGVEDMSLADDHEEEDEDEIKALFDSGADLIEIDDSEADDNDDLY